MAWLAAALGAIEFLFRALLRTNSGWLSDLAAPYVSTRLWLSGANPYDPHIFLPAWYARGAPQLPISEFVSGTHSVYPPPTLVVMVPFALLRWPDGVTLFILTGLVLYAAVIYGLLRLGWPQHQSWAAFTQDPMAVLFVGVALGFAPVHTAFNSLNIVLLAACTAILGVLSVIRTSSWDKHRNRRGVCACVAISAAICYKPTTGIFLLPWLVRERRWHLLAAVLGVCGIITVASFEPLLAHQGLSWIANYKNNVTQLFTHGGNADISQENYFNTDRIDLQLVLFALTQSRTVSSVVAAVAYVIILAAFVRGAGWAESNASPSHRVQPNDLPLLVAAGFMALGLLPVYSRVYAAVVLLPLVLWCFGHLRFSAARWLLALLADFLLNTSAILRRSAWIPAVKARAPRLWDFTIGGHTCWLLLAIGVLLVRALHQQRSETVQIVH